MSVPVNGYERIRLGRVEHVDSHHRDEPSTRFFHKGGDSKPPSRTPEQMRALRLKFERPFH